MTVAKESFMLVSLKEDKAKKLAQVISNPTCTKILNYLAGKDATESQIAKDLGVPLSTVHYNLQQLVEAKLVVADEFHYSEKGREVNHYKLANKYIIIAPQEDDSFLRHLKKYIPAVTIVVAVGAVLKLMQVMTHTVPVEEAQNFAATIAEPAADAARTMATDVVNATGGAAAKVAAEGAREAADTMIEQTADAGLQAVPESMMMAAPAPALPVEPGHWWQTNLVDYFIAGALFVLLVIIIVEAVNYLREKRA
jgi:DNA-binding transcriptional ArsR family regulator